MRTEFEDYFLKLDCDVKAQYEEQYPESYWWAGYYSFLGKKSLGVKIKPLQEIEFFRSKSTERVEAKIFEIKQALVDDRFIKAFSILYDVEQACGISLKSFDKEISNIKEQLVSSNQDIPPFYRTL